MTTPYLPDDCIYYILKYLQPYRLTLFNCLLVNRFWCKATVPLLYADPFVKPYKTNFHYRHSKIILTLILCFNKANVSQLKNLINIDINDEYKPLFKYPKYLENYDYYNINDIISRWTKTNDCHENFEAILEIFHQSILYQCNNNIKKLEIPICYNNKNWMVQTFTNLNSLILRNDDSNEIASEFFNNLANICLNLRKLEINLFYRYDRAPFEEKIHTFIQKQNNLKVFGFTGSLLPNNIFLSLELQKNSLVYVEFENIDFNKISFKYFINLYNLKYLKFCNCKRMSLDTCETLKFASFNLDVLMIKGNRWDDIITSSMIKYLGTSLKKLALIEYLNDHIIIESVSLYCFNLIALDICFKNNLIIPYFKNLKIRTLTLFNYNTIESYINLANNLLTSVKEVYIWYLNDPQHFKVFLENCHNYLEIIYLNNPLGHHVKLGLLKIILNTERSNDNLKFFIMENQYDDGNNEELELLDQIKAKGIKITVVPYKYRPDFKRYIYE